MNLKKKKRIRLKTNTQRNKERRKRLKRVLLRKSIIASRRAALFDRIELIKERLSRIAKIKRRKKALEARKRKRYILYGTKDLGRYRYHKPDREILLPDELPTRLSSLRRINTDIWDDRLDSFRRRNMLETTHKKGRVRKHRKVWMERYDHKIYNREQAAKYEKIDEQIQQQIQDNTKT